MGNKTNFYLLIESLYAITSQLSPVPSISGGSSSGIQVLVTDTFKLHSYQTPTGI